MRAYLFVASGLAHRLPALLAVGENGDADGGDGELPDVSEVGGTTVDPSENCDGDDCADIPRDAPPPTGADPADDPEGLTTDDTTVLGDDGTTVGNAEGDAPLPDYTDGVPPPAADGGLLEYDNDQGRQITQDDDDKAPRNDPDEYNPDGTSGGDPAKSENDDDDGDDPDEPLGGALLETRSRPRDLRTHPTAPDEVSEASFDHKFANAERHLHQELEAMTPKAKSAASFLQTEPGEQTDLDARVAALHHRLQEDVADIKPAGAELSEPDVGSLLQTGDDSMTEAKWKQRMANWGKHTSWAQLKAEAEQTKERTQIFAPSSFAQVSGRVQATTEEMMAQLAQKEKAEEAATNAEIDSFTRQTNAEIEQLRVPHTTIAAALARAKAGASSFVETAGFDDLEAKLRHLQALQGQHLDELAKAQRR